MATRLAAERNRLEDRQPEVADKRPAVHMPGAVALAAATLPVEAEAVPAGAEVPTAAEVATSAAAEQQEQPVAATRQQEEYNPAAARFAADMPAADNPAAGSSGEAQPRAAHPPVAGSRNTDIQSSKAVHLSRSAGKPN